MKLFQRNPKCPTCNNALKEKPKCKERCPHCNNFILVRDGQLVTEEQAFISEWLTRLEYFGITLDNFNQTRNQLSKQFGVLASVNDTVWRILNELIIKHGTDNVSLEQIYREMSSLVSREGRDPTSYLLEAEKVRKKRVRNKTKKQWQVFLGSDELVYVRGLRSNGKLEKADDLLKKAEPTPAVLDEIRKNASTKAKQAKKKGDWMTVIQCLEGYSAYADKNRQYCIEMVNAEPPPHTKTDIKLLQKAKLKITE